MLSDFPSAFPCDLPSGLLSDLLSDLPSDLPSALLSDFPTGASAGFDSLFASAALTGAAPELRKSVAYQPLPFSWNPAAVSILENVGLPHALQTVRVASLSLCRNSCWCPQLEQRYS